MHLPDSSDPHVRFDYFSNEYAQAVQAFNAIEDQASTLLLLGCSDDLRGFIDQFVEMASRTRAFAASEREANFVEWFDELIERAGALRSTAVRR